MNPDQFCAESVARPGSSLYYSLLFADPARSKAVIAAHALAEALRDIAASADNASGANKAELAVSKLGWWTQELSGLSAGRARHPISLALHENVHAKALQQSFGPMLSAVELAIHDSGFASGDEAEHFAQALGGQLGAFEHALFAGSASTRQVSMRIGKAIELCNAFRAGAGRPLEHAWMLPGDLLARHSVGERDLQSPQTPAHLSAALATYVQRIETLLCVQPPVGTHGSNGPDRDDEESAHDSIPGTLLARAEMTRLTLRALARSKFKVIERRIGISPLRKLWIAWRHRSASRLSAAALAAGDDN